MKIIIVSDTPWQDNNSFGSSFSNIFGGDFGYEIANVYCQTGGPNTKVCHRFFQITEKGIIQSILKKGITGREIFNSNSVQNLEKNEELLLKKIKIARWQLFFWARDLVWATGQWRSKNLYDFINNFRPDLIVLPIYYSTYLNNIGLYIKRLTGKPLVGYISDDCYSLKQFSISPLYWVDRLVKRIYVKKAIESCDVLFTITETQKNEYNTIFGNKCKVLFKGGDFSNFDHRKTELNNPLKFVYTGNIGSGRWKTLALIGDALAKTNNKAELIIYSQTLLSKKNSKRLLQSGIVKFMGAIHSSKVKDVQRDADILVHVESFELKERYSARLSFSTKIVDYLEAGRCILAVGWEQTGAIDYLKKYDGAVVITNRELLENEIIYLTNNYSKIVLYGDKSFNLGKQYHQIEKIRDELYNNLIQVVGNEIE